MYLEFTFQVFDIHRTRFISRQAVQQIIHFNHGEYQLEQRLYRLITSLHRKYGVSYKTQEYSIRQFRAMVRLAPDLIHRVTELQVSIRRYRLLPVSSCRTPSRRRLLGGNSGMPKLEGQVFFRNEVI